LVHDGRVTGPAPVAEIVTPETLWTIYGVRVEFISAPDHRSPVICPLYTR